MANDEKINAASNANEGNIADMFLQSEIQAQRDLEEAKKNVVNCSQKHVLFL